MGEKPEIPRLIFKKLGSRKASGLVQYHVAMVNGKRQRVYEKAIYIDERLAPKEKFKTVIHELGHYFFPDLNEDAILNFEDFFAEALWSYGVRFTEQD